MTTDFASHLGGIARIPRFFLWRLEWNAAAGKFAKHPCALDGSAYKVDASQAAAWTDYATAQAALAALAPLQREHVRHALGWWLVAGSGYWFADVDRAAVDGKWLPFAEQFVQAFRGAFVEVSSSNTGLHIIGSGDIPSHRNKPPREVAAQIAPLELELYSEGRGIAFGLTQQAQGCADTRCDVGPLCSIYFPPATSVTGGDYSTPRADWSGHADDDVLLQRALSAKVSAESAFNGKANFGQLHRGEVAKENGADLALASHLAFWTGCDAPRIERLMRRSGLARPKWDESRPLHARADGTRPRGTLLQYTIETACAACTNVYQEPQRTGAADEASAASLTTELSNAYRLKVAHGSSMIAVPGVGWHVWGDAGPWTQDDHAAYRLAFGLGVAIKAEADSLDDWCYQATLDGLGLDECKRRADVQKNRRSWAKASESKAVIDHSLALAERLLSVPAEKLDASPLLVGCPSGVLDLATCTMREHRREDYITKRVACDFDPAARAPTWDRFIAEIMAHDPGLITYLQTLCGYILSGTRGEHILPVFHGTGSNGKSVLLTTLQTLLGDYAGTAAPGLLIARNGSEHPTGLASLQGRRLIVVSETGEAGRLNEEQVKQLTGGDRIMARRMHQNFFEFTPSHQIILATNHKPRVANNDEGIWRRLKLVPFAVTIAPERRDTGMLDKLAAELPGVLRWCIDGWRMYRAQGGFREPAAVRVATADYRSDSDHVGAFLADRCTLGAELSVASGAIYTAYTIWCAQNGERPLTQRSLGQRLAERAGIEQTRTNQARTWRGLSIAPHAVPGSMLTLVK